MNWLIVVLMIATTVLMVRPVAARAQGPVDFLKVTFIGRSQARGSILTIATVVALQFALAVPANASPGDRDPAFGGDGKVTTNFIKGFDSASDLAIQGDGKIVAGGSGGSRFALARYKHNASLDSIVGGDGKVTTKFNRGRSVAYGVVIQGNGKIIAVGSARDGGRFALARYRLNGSLDSTFGGDGRVTTKFGERSAASDVAIQEDGKIVAAGSAKN